MEGQVEHKTVPVNGINMHFAEIGQGPLVLFIHGFPEFWYSWRHQMSFMAKQGYRAVSPDLRGYGDTTGAPKDDPSKFTTLDIVGDLVELLNKIAPQEEKVFVVGHDWGAVASWALCLYRPEKVKAFVCLSVAFNPRNPMKKPLETLRAVYGDDYYVVRFQVLFHFIFLFPFFFQISSKLLPKLIFTMTSNMDFLCFFFFLITFSYLNQLLIKITISHNN